MPRSAGQPLTRSTVKVAPSAASGTDLVTAATLDATAVLAALGTGPDGPTPAEANRRRAEDGPNAVRTRHARALGVLGHQLRSALLVLLLVTAVVSYVLGERTEALIIGTILAASIGLGFANEYRAERAAEALHSSMRHLVTAIRGGAPVELDVTGLVPGDVVLLQLGAVVPADIRLLEVSGLECDESVLTGESDPAVKDPVPVPAGTALADLSSCALMGTVVRAGSGRGVVVATGGRAEFSRIALGLGERQPETEFQVGLRRFSMLLLQVAVALTALILVANVRDHVRAVPRRARAVPDRLVHRIARHAVAGDLRDPHPAGTVPAQQAQRRADRGHVRRGRGGGGAAVLPAGSATGLHPTAGPVLPCPHRARRGLPGPPTWS